MTKTERALFARLLHWASERDCRVFLRKPGKALRCGSKDYICEPCAARRFIKEQTADFSVGKAK